MEQCQKALEELKLSWQVPNLPFLETKLESDPSLVRRITATERQQQTFTLLQAAAKRVKVDCPL